MAEEEGAYDITATGTVASMFYYSPFDVADLTRNWARVFERDRERDDHWVAMALGNVDSNRPSISSVAEREEVGKFSRGLDACERAMGGGRGFAPGCLKAGCCYHNLLLGRHSHVLGAAMRGLQADFERLCEVLCAVDQMGGRWGKRDYFKRLHLRILYGVPEEMVDLCRIRGIGKVKARRLWDANLRDPEAVSGNVVKVIKALNCSRKVADEVCAAARQLL